MRNFLLKKPSRQHISTQNVEKVEKVQKVDQNVRHVDQNVRHVRFVRLLCLQNDMQISALTPKNVEIVEKSIKLLNLY